MKRKPAGFFSFDRIWGCGVIFPASSIRRKISHDFPLWRSGSEGTGSKIDAADLGMKEDGPAPGKLAF